MDITLERILSLLEQKPNGEVKHGEFAKLAKLLGFQQSNIASMWISGKSKSYQKYLYQISSLYGVSVEWLKGESDEKYPPAKGMDDKDLMFALFGSTDMTQEDLEDVRRYAEFIKQKKKGQQ